MNDNTNMESTIAGPMDFRSLLATRVATSADSVPSSNGLRERSGLTRGLPIDLLATCPS